MLLPKSVLLAVCASIGSALAAEVAPVESLAAKAKKEVPEKKKTVEKKVEGTHYSS